MGSGRKYKHAEDKEKAGAHLSDTGLAGKGVIFQATT